MLVIKITGKKRAGKSQTADFLAKLFEEIFTYRRVKQLSFADGLKSIACRSLRLSKNRLEDLKNDEVKLTPIINYREFLQNLGDGLKAQFGQDIMLKGTIETIKKLQNNYDVIIIPDWRFQYENFDIDGVEVITIRVTRGIANNKIDLHQSENDLLNVTVDYEIANDDTLAYLHTRCKEIIKDIIW